MPEYQYAYRWAWLFIGFLLVMLTIAGSLAPDLPEGPVTLNDKFLHLFVYTVLGSWFGSIVWPRWPTLVGLLSLGLGLELLQALGGARQAEWLDMLANTCGALLGTIVISPFVARPVLVATDRFLASIMK